MLGVTTRIYARKCQLREITPTEEIEFMKYNHLQGYVGGSIYRYGLFYEGQIVAVMTFRKPRNNIQYADFELYRFANKTGFNVIGGASKLLKRFLKDAKYPTVMSYANRRWSNGHLYKSLGFSFLRTSDPYFFYFKDIEITRTPKLLHWHSQQKHLAVKLLENYDHDVSVEQNFFNHGYRKIYDAGQLVYILS